MRYREPFTVYPRKLKTVTVFYYQCYDSEGRRTNGRSTGQITRAAARVWCMKLYREGKLIPERKLINFGEFAEGWWDIKTCKYLEWRQLQNPLALSTIDHYKTCLENHIKPYFGKMPLNAVTHDAVQKWILYLSRKGYANASINIQIAALKMMMKEAVRLNLISANPLDKIKKLQADNKEVRILKIGEVQRLFPRNWQDIWDSFEVYFFNKLAACTGMRPGELMGLKGEHIFSDHIHVCTQYSVKYGVMPLKTKDSRDIPITGFIYNEIAVLAAKNGQGFIFSENGGKEPFSRSRVYRESGAAFDRIGISKEERRRRGIALHHWRHFLNTALLMANINTLKVQKVTGHKSISMTKHYAHFDSREFTEVLDVQNSLLSDSAPITESI
jgi:integrase